MATQIQLRRGTAAQWTTANPILAEGEMGRELDTGFCKIGDGVTAWNALPYCASYYAPTVPGDWPDPDPTNVAEALDSLAEQVTAAESSFTDMQVETVTAQTIVITKPVTYVEVNLSSNGTINLPLLSGVQSGTRITLQKAGSGNVDVMTSGTDTINDSLSSWLLNGSYETVTVVAGTDWRIE